MNQLNQQNNKIKNPSFFKAKAITLAKQLLGKIIVIITSKGNKIKARIIETEAYAGIKDKACHAYNNNFSLRTAPMYKQGGFTYVYIIYGIHHCFNIVASKENDPQAVLIRSVEIVDKNTNITINGPGNTCKMLKINKSLNNIDLTTSKKIYLEYQPSITPERIGIGKRINIQYAGKYADKPWRFYIKNL